MGEAYLFDTNFVSALIDGRNDHHDEANKFLVDKAASSFWCSIIAFAEIEYGLKIAPLINDDLHKSIRAELSKFSQATNLLAPNRHTIQSYSSLRAELFKRYSPRDKRGRLTKKWPEDLHDRTTSKTLGIQENDIWLAAQAIERNLVLVTNDSMRRIAEVSQSLDDPLIIHLWRTAG